MLYNYFLRITKLENIEPNFLNTRRNYYFFQWITTCKTIIFNLFDRRRNCNIYQCSKHETSITITEEGILISLSDSQYWKVPSLGLVKPLGSGIFISERHENKASFPIAVTEEEIINSLIWQRQKAKDPIFVNGVGNDIVDSNRQSIKAKQSILVNLKLLSNINWYANIRTLSYYSIHWILKIIDSIFEKFIQIWIVRKFA